MCALSACRRVKHALALALCLVTGAAGADSWSNPLPRAYASPTGLRVVRVIPGTDKGAVLGYQGAPRGAPARAIVYRLNTGGDYAKSTEFELLNPISPMFAAVSDNGELITLDNWHNMGIGESVVVVYSPQGRVVRSLGLAIIYSAEELAKLPLSVSSIWWRCGSDAELHPRSPKLEFMDALGSSVEISLKTGEVTRSPSSRKGC